MPKPTAPTTGPVDDTTGSGDTTPTTDLADAAPAAYTFPFAIPEDLSAASDEDLRALHTQVAEHIGTFRGLSPAQYTPDTLAAIEAGRNLALDIRDELSGRSTRFADATDLLDDPAFAEIDDLTGEPDEDGVEDGDVLPDPEPVAEPAPTDPTPAPAPASVTAAGPRRTPPRVRDVARGSRAPQLPQSAQVSTFGTMVSAADLPGYPTGKQLNTFADAVNALEKAADQYPSNAAQKSKFAVDKRPITVYDADVPGREIAMHRYTRRPVVEIRRNFPADLRVKDLGDSAYRVAMHAADTRRLPGGNLVNSIRKQVEGGKSLTAAAGWCAPSQTIYDLVETETEDGILDAPELETPRGGWNIPINGGPEFATIYGMIGNGGDTHLSEQQVIDDTPKISVEIPCPPFEEVRLGVDYYSLTGGLLQRRGYPEAMARFSRAAAIALTHKINRGFIADIVAGSQYAGVVPVDAAGDDAASAFLAAVDLAIMDAQYRNRGGFNSTMEVPIPRWGLVQIRAALSRRNGVAYLSVSDAQIMAWFAERNAVVKPVVDWQDAFSGLATGPGGAVPLLRLPTQLDFLVYPAGTWVKAVQDVVALDTIYDSTLLTTNQFLAVFAETGWAALKMQPLSRRYTVRVDPSGVVGCCDGADMALIS